MKLAIRVLEKVIEQGNRKVIAIRNLTHLLLRGAPEGYDEAIQEGFEWDLALYPKRSAIISFALL